jgi:hypothetical protein
MKTYIGIDNGVSGTIGIINEEETSFFKVPTKSEQNYTKKKGNVTRINGPELIDTLNGIPNPMALIERPMVNPTRFKATTSALRALEAVLLVLEALEIPYQYIDSKEWQRELLPKGIKGTPELKKASKDIGCRLFPQYKELIEKHGDADGLLISEYCRRKF